MRDQVKSESLLGLLSTYHRQGGICASETVVRRAYVEYTAARLGGRFLGRSGPSHVSLSLSHLLSSR